MKVSTMLLNRVSIDETVSITWCSSLPGPSLTISVHEVIVFMIVLTSVETMEMRTEAVNVVTAPVLKSPSKPPRANLLLMPRNVLITMTMAGVSRK